MGKSQRSIIPIFVVALMLGSAAALAAQHSGPVIAPVPKGTTPPYNLEYQLTCGVYANPVLSHVAIVNHGPGTVPTGMKVHWHLVMTPPPNYDGGYTFTAPLSPGAHVFVPSTPLPFSPNAGACTVTLL